MPQRMSNKRSKHVRQQVPQNKNGINMHPPQLKHPLAPDMHSAAGANDEPTMANEHPIALELASLKAALEDSQHDAHLSSLQLRRAYFEATEAIEYSKKLEADYAHLQQEVELLRANPDTTPASFQTSELTLALRRISDKLTVTESTLLQRTTELTHVASEKSRIQLEVATLHAELDRVRRLEEACRMRERELERRCRVAGEEAKMVDTVIMEYADLVRTLEGRRSKASDEQSGLGARTSLPLQSNSTSQYDETRRCFQATSESLVQMFKDNRLRLHRLRQEFDSETSQLHGEITRLHAQLSSVLNDLDCERENSKQDRIKLAETLLEVDRCKADDQAAAKIVSRYMQFSQSSITTLQTALSTLKMKHATILRTMSGQYDTLSQSLTLERTRTSQLRDILDELTEDVSRETCGRRREVTLRIQSIAREEQAVERLKAWLRRMEEGRVALLARSPGADSTISEQVNSEELGALWDSLIQDARTIVASLSFPERSSGGSLDDGLSGRIVLAEATVQSLVTDLNRETEKRMGLTRRTAAELLATSGTPLETAVPQGVNLSPAPSPAVVKGEFSTLSSVETEPVFDLIPSPMKSSPGESASQSPAAEQGDCRLEHDVAGVVSEVQEPQIHTEMRTNLTHISSRYEELQRAFRDCHLALSKLQADFARNSQSVIPALMDVTHRLDDFCEDARVDLEIRIADEERIMKGFETVLCIPGVLANEKEKSHVEEELRSFSNGTSPSVMKAVEAFKSKLDDLQHDIAQVKRIFHETTEDAPEDTSSFPKTQSGWPSWTSSFLPGLQSRSGSSAPSFGMVVTTPRPSLPSPKLISTNNSKDANQLIAHMELRIPMPSQASPALPLQPLNDRLRSSTPSSMYLLGLGSRSGFFHKRYAIMNSEEIEGGSTPNDESDVE